jgi:glucose-6-phosphate isomerase
MNMTCNLAAFQSKRSSHLQTLKKENIIARIWDHDHTVWKPDPTEISNRLGWLRIMDHMKEETRALTAFARALQAEGFSDAVLLGMGGSSLAPEVFQRTFGTESSPLNLQVLDTTDPTAIRTQAQDLDPEKTLFIVATKSGSTVETLSLFKYFYNWTVDRRGKEEAGAHFIGITDPGSNLVDLAERYQFREVFLNDPRIGGRYSALSFFGLVPAALVGVDLSRLLERALSAAQRCRPGNVEDNPGAILGAALGRLALEGRDKVTFVASDGIASFPNWIEQLIAESTGKQGTGILPVVHEPLGDPGLYRDDRLFVHLKLPDDPENQPRLQPLQEAGHPVITFDLKDRYDLGEQFFLWEFATAVAGSVLGINPFDQPNVESAKVRAREMVEVYRETGALPDREAQPPSPSLLNDFINTQAEPGSYIALQAFLPPTPENQQLLNEIRLQLRDRFRYATTLGFGPRFLHSTGQLHKGDAGNGLFIQFTSQAEEDLPIPDQAGTDTSSIHFGTLKLAQALGDARALREAGRKIIHFELGQDVAQRLNVLIQKE